MTVTHQKIFHTSHFILKKGTPQYKWSKTLIYRYLHAQGRDLQLTKPCKMSMSIAKNNCTFVVLNEEKNNQKRLQPKKERVY
jgi:hypothetical protein